MLTLEAPPPTCDTKTNAHACLQTERFVTLFLIITNICCDSRLVFVCCVISPSLHQQVSPFPLCDGADTHAVQLTLHVGQVRHLRTQVSDKQVNSLVCV